MRRALIASGLLAMGYAVAGALTDPDVEVVGVLIFLVAVLIAHDGVLLPAMIGIGALVGRLADPAPVRVAAICSAAVILVGVPLLLGHALLWAAALVVLGVRRIRKHPERSGTARHG